jgi:hypothetical protein
MGEWFTNAPQLVVYLIGVLAIMVGGILFVGALLLKPKNAEGSLIPSMQAQAQTIPPYYKPAPDGGRLGRALETERRLMRNALGRK